jgi:Sulfotransferase family
MTSIDASPDLRPVFIVGPPRCGTTLCSRVLAQSPTFFVPGDTYFMEDVFTRFRTSDALKTETARTALVDRLATIYQRFNAPEDHERLTGLLNHPKNRHELIANATSWDKAYAAFMQMQATSAAATRWVNHAPKDVFYVSELAQAFPSSKFVFCIRDPRDFMLSYKYKWRATSQDNVNRITSLYNPILTALLWRASARAILKHVEALPDSRTMVLRYEDFVERPEEIGQRLYAFVGENFRSKYLNVGFSNSSHGLPSSGITSASVGRWIDSLPKNETWWAECIAKSELAAFNYESSSASIGYPRAMMDVMRAPGALYKALDANREHTGPLIPYVTRRLISLLGR